MFVCVDPRTTPSRCHTFALSSCSKVAQPGSEATSVGIHFIGVSRHKSRHHPNTESCTQESGAHPPGLSCWSRCCPVLRTAAVPWLRRGDEMLSPLAAPHPTVQEINGINGIIWRSTEIHKIVLDQPFQLPLPPFLTPSPKPPTSVT